MAEPEIVYYKVTVDSVFQTRNVLFRPKQTFRVRPDIYNSPEPVTIDGRAFKDACVTATPEYARQ